jgi:hypothetical protein
MASNVLDAQAVQQIDVHPTPGMDESKVAGLVAKAAGPHMERVAALRYGWHGLTFVLVRLVPAKGFEPSTFCSGGRRSIH